jgi:hypothetical protein
MGPQTITHYTSGRWRDRLMWLDLGDTGIDPTCIDESSGSSIFESAVTDTAASSAPAFVRADATADDSCPAGLGCNGASVL